jgi:uncharacterized protein YegL
MNKNLTEIVAVVDRSGSMNSCREEMEGGFNSFIDTQKKAPGEARLTLVQFDDRYDVVHNGVPIKDVPPFQLEPRGWTALRDAVGRAITEVGNRLDKTPEDQRPGLVVVMIVTDGKENHSREFSAAQVREMISRQEKVYNWQFMYLGANHDVFAAADAIGIQPTNATSYEEKTAGALYDGMACKLLGMRMASARGGKVDAAFTDEERAKIAGKTDEKK